ncbi:MAG: hypothetical protein FalmKO_43680 [Falsiruegeria mediterranea]
MQCVAPAESLDLLSNILANAIYGKCNIIDLKAMCLAIRPPQAFGNTTTPNSIAAQRTMSFVLNE